MHAGLAGLWFIRNTEEDDLNLPSGEYEARQYRFRVINASNARVYRLLLVDERGNDCSSAITQIGTDGGLLGASTPLPEGGLLLASAERADLIVDLRMLPLQEAAGTSYYAVVATHFDETTNWPNEMVTLAMRFEGATGRYMFHCHILEHEDHDMTRTFVVMPGSVLAHHGHGGDARHAGDARHGEPGRHEHRLRWLRPCHPRRHPLLLTPTRPAPTERPVRP